MSEFESRVARRNVILATFGSHGDVHPFVGIGKALKARGHTVTVHTSGYFESLVRGAGLGFSGLGSAEEFRKQIGNPMMWHRTKGFKAVFGEGVCGTLRRSYETLKEMVTPDTVLVGSSLALAARVVHDEVGCPGATVHLSPMIMRSCVAPAVMPGLFMPRWMPMWLKQKIWETGDRRMLDPLVCPTLNGLRVERGLPPVERVLNGWWHHPGRIIGMWPDWYGPSASDWPGQFRHAGFPLYDESDVTPLPESLEAFLKSGPPPIAFTPGSAMLFGQRFFEAAAGACAAMGRRGLLLTRHPEQIPKSLPAGVIHVPYAPFGRLLPRCAAIVHHGGIGTTSQGLRAGIPQVITHFSHDQPDNADRLTRLGVGTGMRASKVTADRLARALDRLLGTPETIKACKALAARKWDDGLDRACDLIETAT